FPFHCGTVTAAMFIRHRRAGRNRRTISRTTGLTTRSRSKGMEIQEALAVIRKLADGVHPETGTALPGYCVYHQLQVVRALHRAMAALEFQEERERVKKFLPKNAGKPWSNQ